MDWFLYDKDLRHERVNPFEVNVPFLYHLKSTTGNAPLLYLLKKNTRSFLTFSGGIKVEHWHEMG